MDWKSVLEESYEKYINDNRNETKLSFLGDVVFNLTTYSNTQSERLARDMLKVVEAITRGKTFEFIEDEENYNLYITCVNLAWFSGRLDWGTSIRGAWWATYDMPPICTCELYYNGSQLVDPEIVEQEWEGFINSVIEFAKEQ